MSTSPIQHTSSEDHYLNRSRHIHLIISFFAIDIIQILRQSIDRSTSRSALVTGARYHGNPINGIFIRCKVFVGKEQPKGVSEPDEDNQRSGDEGDKGILLSSFYRVRIDGGIEHGSRAESQRSNAP